MTSETAIDRVSRLITLIPLLSQQRISLNELSRAAGISKETIARDFEIIFMCGLPGYTPDLLIDLDLDGEYVSIRDPQNLNKPEEIENEVLIFSILGLYLLRETVARGNSQYDAITKLLRKLERQNFLRVEFDVPEKSRTLSVVRDAIDFAKVLKFNYIDLEGKETRDRRVLPTEITWRNGEALLRGIDLEINEFRHFFLAKLSSITEIENHPREKDLIRPKITEKNPKKIRLKISMGQGWWIKLMRPMISSLAVDSEGGVEIELSYWSDDWLLRALAGIYGNCEILREDREALEKRLRAYLAAL
jgi:predicted DNA-binding transcriptional regulator YafY